MKVRLVCDCCDNVFREIEVPADAGMTDFEALTGEEIKDIILPDSSGAEIVISATCHDCNNDLSFNGRDLVYYSEPKLH